jgi:uncharacterized membrane protein
MASFLTFCCAIAALITAARALSATRSLGTRLHGLEGTLRSGFEGQFPETAPPESQAAMPAPLRVPPLPPAPPVGPVAAVAPARPPLLPEGWERILVEHWLVWLGGLALALGGAFLVKFSIDTGLLTPPVRVVLGVLLGIGLWGGAEWVAWGERAEQGPAAVAQALAAAGAVTIFASLFAAHQLYGLLPPGLAFPLLAATAAGTVLMSLQHGPFVAALGLAGAFAVPLLVHSDQPHPAALFAYLAVVGAASLALLRCRAWWWLGWISLAGSLGWALLWLGGLYRPADVWILGGFLLLQLGLFAALRRGIGVVPLLAGVIDLPGLRVLVRSAFWGVSLAIFVLVHVDGYGTAALGCALLAAVFLLRFGYRDAGLDDVIAAAGALPLALLASWDLPFAPVQRIGLLHSVMPERVGEFMTTAMIFGVLLGGGGFGGMGGARRPGRWAALSAAAPPIILAIVYWRVQRFGLDIAWSAAALGLAGFELAAAVWASKRRNGGIENEIALAAYAVGVLGSTILAAAIGLENAWLTVALALHLPALGWIDGRLRLPVLRHLALGVAAAVLVRLALNPEILRYPLSETPIFNWLLYGYGVPALAFIAATRQFGSRADDALVAVLEAGGILFSVLLLTFELRHALGDGQLDRSLGDLWHDAPQTLVWLGASAFLLNLGARRSRKVLVWGGIILFGLASTQAVLWQALVANPLWDEVSVGKWLVFDLLGLAYGLPALLYAVIAMLRRGPPALQWTARLLALGFGLLWASLEIRHFFQGELLTGGLGEAEWYAYSAAWLAFAGAGFAIGLVRHDPWLRHAALWGIGLVVAKVFLSDMAQLSGALRAFSFLGLGAALVAIGYGYRRLRPMPNPT